jgi:hypothetical protein
VEQQLSESEHIRLKLALEDLATVQLTLDQLEREVTSDSSKRTLREASNQLGDVIFNLEWDWE